MLLYCHSRSRQVIFQGTPDKIHYFDGNGVQTVDNLGSATVQIGKALQNSWVLIDVDSPTWEGHSSGGWLSSAPVVIMTSALNLPYRSTFVEQFNARVWIMKPWSHEELIIEARLRGVPVNIVSEFHQYGGPVPRSIFANTPPNEHFVQCAIASVMLKGVAASIRGTLLAPLALATSDPACQKISLISPTLQADGTLDRGQPAVSMLSPRVSDMLVENLAEDLSQLDRIWEEIRTSVAVKTSVAAENMLESMFRLFFQTRGLRVFLEQLHTGHPLLCTSQDVVGEVLIDGSIDNMQCEPRGDNNRARPLYFRPVVGNFPVSAVIITNTHLYAIRIALSPVNPHIAGKFDAIAEALGNAGYDTNGLVRRYCWIGSDRRKIRALVDQSSAIADNFTVSGFTYRLGDPVNRLFHV